MSPLFPLLNFFRAEAEITCKIFIRRGEAFLGEPEGSYLKKVFFFRDAVVYKGKKVEGFRSPLLEEIEGRKMLFSEDKKYIITENEIIEKKSSFRGGLILGGWVYVPLDAIKKGKEEHYFSPSREKKDTETIYRGLLISADTYITGFYSNFFSLLLMGKKDAVPFIGTGINRKKTVFYASRKKEDEKKVVWGFFFESWKIPPAHHKHHKFFAFCLSERISSHIGTNISGFLCPSPTSTKKIKTFFDEDLFIEEAETIETP